MKKEIRAGNPVEVREDGGDIKVSGYAAVFNSETVIGGSFRERIAVGAFSKAVSRDDVMFLINHDGLPLARTKSGTLSIREDDKGLFMEAELDPTDPQVQSIIPKMRRGDLDKMSFAFRARSETWDESGPMALRTITEADLFDVSIVTYPAYADTSIGLRSLQDHQKTQYSSAPVATRMRMKLALGLAAK